MNGNNMNYIPGSVSGYPQSDYPQQTNPFPSEMPPSMMDYYPEENKPKVLHIVIVSVVVVLIALLVATLIIVKRAQISPQMGSVIYVSDKDVTAKSAAGKASINFCIKDKKIYLSIEDVAKNAGYEYMRDGKKVEISNRVEVVTFNLDSAEAKVMDRATEKSITLDLIKAPVEDKEKIFIYMRDLVVLKDTKITFNYATDVTEITIGVMNVPSSAPAQTVSESENDTKDTNKESGDAGLKKPNTPSKTEQPAKENTPSESKNPPKTGLPSQRGMKPKTGLIPKLNS